MSEPSYYRAEGGGGRDPAYEPQWGALHDLLKGRQVSQGFERENGGELGRGGGGKGQGARVSRCWLLVRVLGTRGLWREGSWGRTPCVLFPCVFVMLTFKILLKERTRLISPLHQNHFPFNDSAAAPPRHPSSLPPCPPLRLL